MTLKDQSFVNKFKVSFVCLPEDVCPSNVGKCLRDNLIIFFSIMQKYSFPKSLNFVQNFV